MEDNDLIRRSDVLGLIEVDFRYEQCNQVSDYVKNIPAVDAALVVHGRWKSMRGNFVTGGGNPMWGCNKCGKFIGASMNKPKYKYCPHCGAKMYETD